jgi:penicillin amidase
MNLRNVLFFLFAALLTGTLTWGLNRGWVVEGQPIPAFGKLLNPFTGFWQNGEAPIVAPPMPVTANLLGDSVSVHYDDRMVPHIFADTMPDLMFVQGYLHAANRLFQMDFGSRAAAGRLSEVVGEKALDFDRKQREWGFPMAAANAV